MIILMGMAGSGKSMQGRLLADKNGYAWLSTGEILRVLVTGKRRQAMLTGHLLSDAEMIRLIDKVLDLINLNEEFVLDGFPRTLKQADWLIDQVNMGRFKLSAVINLNLPEATVLERLQQRGRQDDTKEAIHQRFEEYKQVTQPILQDFKSRGIPVYDIDGSKTPDQVHNDIVGRL